MKKLTIFAAASTFFALSAAASASAENDWRVRTTDDNGAVLSIVSGSDTVNGTFFTCVGDTLQVGVSLQPGDLVEALDRTTRRTKTKDAVTQIAGQDEFDARWLFFPTMQVAIAKDELSAKKLYNAAVRGDAVSWKMSGRDAIDLQFPASNDAFTSFANDCAVTNPAKQS